MELDRGSFAHSPTPTALETGDPTRPSPADLKTFLPWACCQLQATEEVVVSTVHQVQYVSVVEHKIKRKKSRIGGLDKAVSAYSGPVIDPGSSGESVKSADVGKIRLTAVLNSQEKCVQIKINNNRRVPRLLLKVLALVVKFHSQLATITINSGVDMYTLHEVANILPHSYITEVCFDGAGTPGLDFSVLLSHENHVSHLSLARCRLDDRAVSELADVLTPPEPASTKLTILNLASNRVTDQGARYLAEMLRTNRTLYYLNISDNNISDSGAAAILEVLGEYELTADELESYRERFGQYLNTKLSIMKKLRAQLKETSGPAAPRNYKSKASKSEPTMEQKAESMLTSYIGRFEDPFNSRNTVSRNGGATYCKGNFTLAYLNLAYLNLSLVALRRLLSTVEHQRCRLEMPRGLVAVCVEGNPLPSDCEEFAMLQLVLAAGAPSSQKSLKRTRNTQSN